MYRWRYRKPELVDADAAHAVEPAVVDALTYEPSDDVRDGLPADPHQLGRARHVGDLREVADHLLEAARKAAVRICPGHLLDADAAPPAVDAPDGVAEPHEHGSEGEGLPPARLGSAVVAGGLSAAAPAAGALPGRADIDEERRLAEADVADEHAADAEQAAK